jgi:antitoxin VapB
MPAAKLFTHGGSQAVRLPKEFRFEGVEVYVRRAGNDVVLSPAPRSGPEALIDALAAFEPGAVIQREQPVRQQRRRPIKPAR